MSINEAIGTRSRFPGKYVIIAVICGAASMTLAGCGQDNSVVAPPPGGVTALASPAGPGAAEPHLALDADGSLILSWQTSDKESGQASLDYARLVDGNWSAPQRVAQGDNWFVNWADFPSVEPMGDGRLTAHWLVKREGGPYAYDVWLSQSQDGSNWSEPFIAHHDGTASEHGFVSLFGWGDHAAAVWLDGRETGGSSHDHEGHGGGGMTLRFGVFDEQGEVVQEGLVDKLTCDCCPTDIARVGDGMILAYRDRSGEEMRDIAVRRFDGSSWSEPMLVDDEHWHITGCPVNGPALAANGEQVAIAWFSGATETGQVKTAISRDGGRSFSAPVIVDTEAALGRVDVAWLNDQDIAVSWIDRVGKGAALMAMRATDTSTIGEPVSIAEVSKTRSSGVPQMVMMDGKLIFAWTHVGESTRVELATLDKESL
ncbi:MAG: hypothetical protein OEM03_10875 [Chromatiales bacterium]|nr:hypothetical protein [Chromatiales bacterium]